MILPSSRQSMPARVSPAGSSPWRGLSAKSAEGSRRHSFRHAVGKPGEAQWVFAFVRVIPQHEPQVLYGPVRHWSRLIGEPWETQEGFRDGGGFIVSEMPSSTQGSGWRCLNPGEFHNGQWSGRGLGAGLALVVAVGWNRWRWCGGRLGRGCCRWREGGGSGCGWFRRWYGGCGCRGLRRWGVSGRCRGGWRGCSGRRRYDWWRDGRGRRGWRRGAGRACQHDGCRQRQDGEKFGRVHINLTSYL